jgi:autophagy-related protein 5
MHTRPPSADTVSAPDKDGAYNVRSVPARIYLPDGPVLQDLVPPSLENGQHLVYLVHICKLTSNQGLSHTLSDYLSTHLPLLFPPTSSAPARAPTRDLAYALVQGVQVPPEAEMAWLGATMAGADGWVNVCVGVIRR